MVLEVFQPSFSSGVLSCSIPVAWGQNPAWGSGCTWGMGSLGTGRGPWPWLLCMHQLPRLFSCLYSHVWELTLGSWDSWPCLTGHVQSWNFPQRPLMSPLSQGDLRCFSVSVASVRASQGTLWRVLSDDSWKWPQEAERKQRRQPWLVTE